MDDSQWSTEDKKKLLSAVVEMGGSNNPKSYKTVESSIKWEEIKVDGKSARECKVMYQRLIGKVRKYRTMQEIIADAVANVDGSGKLAASEYPGMPKKPPTAFGLFVKKRSKKFPDIKGNNRMTVFANAWNELTEEKKEVYRKKYLKLRKKYEEELEMFRQNHPDCPLPEPNYISRPKNLPLPSKLFTESRIEKIKKKQPELSNAEAVKILMNKYKELSDGKKLKWIKRAMRSRQTYQDQVDVYMAHNPKSTAKPAVLHLSKDEERIWHSSKGKPVPAPAKNVFNYFCTLKRDTVHHLGISEQSRKLSALYHNLTEEEVKDLTEAFRKEVEEYVQAYTLYYNSLPEEERGNEKSPEEALAVYNRVLQDDQKKRKKKTTNNNTDDKNDKKVVKLSALLPRPVDGSDSDINDTLPSSGVVAPVKRRNEPHVDTVTPHKKRKHNSNSVSESPITPQQSELDEDALLSMWTPQKNNDIGPQDEDIADTPKSKHHKKSKKSKA